MSVLVADDSCVIRRILVDALEEIGVCDVVQASDGNQALEAFAKQTFDLVVLDRVMPFKSGLEVARAIRETDGETPILLVTATGSNRQQVCEALEAGASDYLLKPFEAARLREKLQKYCGAGIARTRPS